MKDNEDDDKDEFVYRGVKIRIDRDEYPPHPRKEFDNAGTMACFHKRYSLGDEDHGIDHREYSGWDAMRKAIRKEKNAAVILPLYLYDHSGLTLSTSSEKFRACDSAGWDWGQVGFIWISREKAIEEWAGKGKKLTKAVLRRAEAWLQSEVEAYNQYLNGDVWCYAVDPDGEDESSCGFFGRDYCVAEAKRVADVIATSKKAAATA